MKAITVEPLKPGSARYEDFPEPGPHEGSILVEAVAVGHGGAVTSAAAVRKNNVIVGSVNANRRHWYKAGNLLARADRQWLSRLITRRVKPEDFQQALVRQPDDIKVVIQFSEV